MLFSCWARGFKVFCGSSVSLWHLGAAAVIYFRVYRMLPLFDRTYKKPFHKADSHTLTFKPLCNAFIVRVLWPMLLDLLRNVSHRDLQVNGWRRQLILTIKERFCQCVRLTSKSTKHCPHRTYFCSQCFEGKIISTGMGFYSSEEPLNTGRWCLLFRQMKLVCWRGMCGLPTCERSAGWQSKTGPELQLCGL